MSPSEIQEGECYSDGRQGKRFILGIQGTQHSQRETVVRYSIRASKSKKQVGRIKECGLITFAEWAKERVN